MKRFEGKIALVTGASKGIGAAIAAELGRLGATVIVNYYSAKNSAETLVEKIMAEGGIAEAIQADVAKTDDINRLFAQINAKYGKLDILVNNAGRYAFTPLESVTADSIAEMLNVNVTGVLLAAKAAAAMMSGGGNIVNISSNAADMAPAMASVYCGSKGAVNAITRVLAKELGPKGIRVNAVAPGAVLTEGFVTLGNNKYEDVFVSETPLGRLGLPSDIAGVVAFLVSDAAGWITGSVLDAAGGWR